MFLDGRFCGSWGWDSKRGKPVQACTERLKNIKTRLMRWKYKIIKVGGISGI